MRKMDIADAFTILKLAPGNYSAKEIQAAFVRVARATHPDSGGFGDVDRVIQAKDRLLNHRNVDDFTCRQCDGLGSVRSRMGVKVCGACQGTGETDGR